RALVVLGEIPDGGALVPALGEIRGTLDDAGEEILGLAEVVALQGLDALVHPRVHLGVPRAAPHVPEESLGLGRLIGVVAAEGLERLSLAHRARAAVTGGCRSGRPPRRRPHVEMVEEPVHRLLEAALDLVAAGAV